MKWKIIWIAIILLLSHLLLEASELLEKVYPHLTNTYIWPVQSPNFKPDWYVNNGINILWWIKYNCDDLVWCISYLTMARIAIEFSFRLALIIGMFLMYHVFDTVMLWWDFKQSHWMFWVMIGIILVGVIIIVWPMKKKSAIIKQMK